jgi:PPOX class probable F420-dependent enzyme
MSTASGDSPAPTEEIYADMGIRRLTALDERCMPILTSTNFAVLSTLSKSGDPHGAPMWIDSDGTDLLVNTETYRAWAKNLARDPRVASVIVNNENPYEYLSIHGRAQEPEAKGAQEHADKLAKRYLGIDKYPHSDRPRRIIRIAPVRIAHIHPPTGGILEETLES